VIAAARVILRRWPDSAETALALARINQVRALREGVSERTRRGVRLRLAELLAFRGRLAEAAAAVDDEDDAALAAELALLGALPERRVARLFERRQAQGSPWARLAPHWWAARGDTAALRAYAGAARARVASGPSGAAAAYDTLAALAYLHLARRDSAGARALMEQLPDTLCRACLADRMTRGRLRLAAGRAGDALRDLGETPVQTITPLEPLLAYWRGVAAERAGDANQARRAYRFVADAWAHGDGSARATAEAARRALARLGR
jgi:hypothetical protein